MQFLPSVHFVIFNNFYNKRWNCYLFCLFSLLFKEIDIKNKHFFFFFDDMVNIKNFHSNLLKIDNKSYKDIDIYYIGYVTIKKFGDCEDLLYLTIYFAKGYFKEKKGEKYLIINSTEKYKEAFSGIKSEINSPNGGKELFYEQIMLKLELILTIIYF